MDPFESFESTGIMGRIYGMQIESSIFGKMTINRMFYLFFLNRGSNIPSGEEEVTFYSFQNEYCYPQSLTVCSA